MSGQGWLVAVAAAVYGGLGPGAAAGHAQRLPSVDEVVERLDELYRSQSSHARMTMTVVRARGTRTLTLEAWSRGEDESLIVIRSPAREAGTATLRTAAGLWSYAPRADRLIRIPSGLLSESWAGSHFTNDDLVRETSYDEDYTSAVSWAERGGERYLQVTMTPKPDAPVVYTKLVFLLTSEEWTPVLWEYYDGAEVVRTMRFENVQRVAGRRLPLRLILQPADAPAERTVIEYEELRLDLPVPADLFTQRGLRRVATG